MKLFLTLFDETGFNGFQGGNRDSTKQQWENMEENKKKGRKSVRMVINLQSLALGNTVNPHTYRAAHNKQDCNFM